MIRKIRIFMRSFAIAGNAGRIAKFAFTHKKETRFLASKSRDLVKRSARMCRDFEWKRMIPVKLTRVARQVLATVDLRRKEKEYNGTDKSISGDQT